MRFVKVLSRGSTPLASTKRKTEESQWFPGFP
nr:MAG TPA: hypothetical protein [Caudoviricetes sp.]